VGKSLSPHIGQQKDRQLLFSVSRTEEHDEKRHADRKGQSFRARNFASHCNDWWIEAEYSTAKWALKSRPGQANTRANLILDVVPDPIVLLKRHIGILWDGVTTLESTRVHTTPHTIATFHLLPTAILAGNIQQLAVFETVFRANFPRNHLEELACTIGAANLMNIS
jgi:hypothetical protein